MELSVEGNETYSYTPDNNASFSLSEINDLIKKVKELIINKNNGKKDQSYEFFSSEAYFEMIIYDSYEDNELSIDLWLNMGSLTSGKRFGYDKGVRFDVTIDLLTQFIDDIENDLNKILETIK